MKQTEFINKVFEIAFGDNARPEYLNDIPKEDKRLAFTFEEVLETLHIHEKNSFKVEDLDESEGFVEGDIIKLGGKKYKVHFENEKLFLQDEDEVNFNSHTNAEKWFDNYLEDSDRQRLHKELDLKIAYPAHFDDLLTEDQEKVKEELDNFLDSNCQAFGKTIHEKIQKQQIQTNQEQNKALIESLPSFGKTCTCDELRMGRYDYEGTTTVVCLSCGGDVFV